MLPIRASIQEVGWPIAMTHLPGDSVGTLIAQKKKRKDFYSKSMDLVKVFIANQWQWVANSFSTNFLLEGKGKIPPNPFDEK